ncbi:MAG: division/cell wall cluster transcriptional repressor MraZ [Chitinophagales bacterium]|nr:division/cell wall cluster transcriptional repressor MraZ [Chitinophagales bacterium]
MGFLGEHECKVDAKGRIKVPAGIKKQLSPSANGRFVINRGFEQCLVLYPFDEWEKVKAKVDRLNTFKKKERNFVRYFYRGATEIILDATDRLNLPKHLLDYAKIEKMALLTSTKNVIEIWNKDLYESEMAMDSDIYAELAEEVMGDDDTPNPN